MKKSILFVLFIFSFSSIVFSQNKKTEEHYIRDPFQMRSNSEAIYDLAVLYYTGTYTALTSSTQLIGSDIDDGISAVTNIGFTFTYNNIAYTQFFVSSNGFLSLGNNTAFGSSLTNDLASTTTKPLLAPLWDDLKTNTDGSVSYYLSGTAPNRVLIVQFKNLKWYWNSTTNFINYQIKLYETTNFIEFVYGTMGNTPGSASASIGLNDETGGVNHFISITPGTSHTVSSSTSNNTITNVSYLPSGFTYKFYKPGSSTTYKGLITPTSTWQNTSYDAATIPYWAFNATAGTTYSFSACSNSEDSYIRIYDINNNIISYLDDNGPYCSGASSSIQFIAPANGVYYIVLSHFSYANLSSAGSLSYNTGDITVTATDAYQTNLSEVLSGSGNNLILEIRITATGTINPPPLSSITFTTSGTTLPADISNAKLWSTGTNSTFSTTTQYGSTVTSPNGSFTFTGTTPIQSGVNYFWLTYDLKPTAKARNYIDASLYNLYINSFYKYLNLSPTGTRKIWNVNYGGGADNSGYYFSNSIPGTGSPMSPPVNWINPVTDGHTLITTWTAGTGDDGYFQIPDIGFNFYFFGTAYRTNNVFIGTNGYLTFGTGSSNLSSYPLPNTNAPLNMIAAALRDLDTRNTNYTDAYVYYKSTPNFFVVTWLHAHEYGSSAVWLSFQIILFPDGAPGLNSQFRINYNDAESSTLASNTILSSCSVGLNNSNGTAGLNYRYNGTRGPIFNGFTNAPLGANAMTIAYGTNESALPVTLKSFTSSVNKRDVTLNWITESEINNAGFEIEKSESGKNLWTKSGYVSAKGNGSSYTFTENNLSSGKYNYRLKQIDLNGNYEYHNLKSEVSIGVPTRYDLSQNYPNPFNPETKINFDIPSDTKVSLIIYDITGREITRLIDEKLKAGYYTSIFRASSLSSGTYFYRIVTDKFTQTKKMLLIK